MTKKEIYAAHGIKFENGKILAPEFGFINPLLINGNAKLGKGVWTFSTLPGTGVYTAEIDGREVSEKGTCPCDCVGCYAKTGFYQFKSTLKSLIIKTRLSRNYPEFVKAAIIAQIHADKVQYCRIHASGDFFDSEYVNMWKDIVKACTGCRFWTYTKNSDAETAFNGFENANIVKSVIPNCGLNFGHCDYIARVYGLLKEQGKQVHICRCGIDKDQHCTNCKGCSENEYVLFIEHSTAYKAESDPAYETVKALIDAQ